MFSGDHALIDISKIISMNPRHVTVRTKSKENQSCDSNATPIPSSALKGKHHSSKVSETLFNCHLAAIIQVLLNNKIFLFVFSQAIIIVIHQGTPMGRL